MFSFLRCHCFETQLFCSQSAVSKGRVTIQAIWLKI